MSRALATTVLSAAAALCAIVPQALSQTQTPTASQVEVFRNLSPEQQRLILEQMGRKGAQGPRPDRELEFPATSEPKPLTSEDMEQTGYLREAEPRLRGNDTVVLSTLAATSRAHQALPTRRARSRA